MLSIKNDDKIFCDFANISYQLHLIENPITGEYVESEFDTSWDWIMSIIDKIDQIGASVIIGRMFCEIRYTNPLNESENFDVRIASGVKINAVNGAAIEFINWYNTTKS